MHNTHMHNTHMHTCTQNYTGAHTRTHGHTRTIAHAGTQVLVLLFILPNVDEQSQFIGDSDGPVRRGFLISMGTRGALAARPANAMALQSCAPSARTKT